jgi:talin
MLVGHSKMVSSSAAGLVIASKSVAKYCQDQQGINHVIALVSQCALSTSQLVACTKVCVSTIVNRECQEQIVEAARLVSYNIDAVVDAAMQYCNNENALDELKTCAKNVYEAISELLDNVKVVNEEKMESTQEESIDRILNATDCLFGQSGDATEMIKQAKILAQVNIAVNEMKTILNFPLNFFFHIKGHD